MFGLVFELGVDGDDRLLDFRAKRCFNWIANLVRVVDTHRAGRHQMKLDKGGRPRRSGPRIVRLNGTIGVGGDDSTNLVDFCIWRCGVQQTCDRSLYHLPSRPQDIERDNQGEQWIEDWPTGDNRQRNTDQNTQGRHNVCQEMASVGDQGPASDGGGRRAAVRRTTHR